MGDVATSGMQSQREQIMANPGLKVGERERASINTVAPKTSFVGFHFDGGANVRQTGEVRWAWDRIDFMPCSGAQTMSMSEWRRSERGKCQKGSRRPRHLAIADGNVRTLSWRARSTFCTLPRHDLVDVALVQEGGGVAAAVAAPVPVVAALVAVTAAGTTSVATNAHTISRKSQIWTLGRVTFFRLSSRVASSLPRLIAAAFLRGVNDFLLCRPRVRGACARMRGAFPSYPKL